MVNVFIGKKSITGKGLAICKVIDCDIATGEDTENEFLEKEEKAYKKYGFIM